MRVIVFALVASAHLAILAVWSGQPDSNAAALNELSVSFPISTQAEKSVTAHPAQPRPAEVPVQPAAHPLSAVAEQAAAVATPMQSAAPATTGVADTEPVYKASYLNNPAPAYPMVARRMGLQGKVVLNVEVLAGGMCGQINIHKSSGYAMLDNAALQTVKTWRFLPASQAGHAVDKWFMIPVQFSLKDNAV